MQLVILISIVLLLMQGQQLSSVIRGVCSQVASQYYPGLEL